MDVTPTKKSEQENKKGIPQKSEKFEMEKVEEEIQNSKKENCKNFYDEFVSQLKVSNPAKWYGMAKRLGTEQRNKSGELSVECLKGLTNKQAAEQVAEHFSKISQEYLPLDNSKLPAFFQHLRYCKLRKRTWLKGYTN